MGESETSNFHTLTREELLSEFIALRSNFETRLHAIEKAGEINLTMRDQITALNTGFATRLDAIQSAFNLRFDNINNLLETKLDSIKSLSITQLDLLKDRFEKQYEERDAKAHATLVDNQTVVEESMHRFADKAEAQITSNTEAIAKSGEEIGSISSLLKILLVRSKR
jgi:hypothetical protein